MTILQYTAKYKQQLNDKLQLLLSKGTVFKSRYLLRKQVRKLGTENKHIKVVIGSASTRYEGWISTDLPALDALNPAHWSYIFPRGSIERILAEHVMEHWTGENFRLFLRTVRPFLSRQGRIRIAVPEGYHPDPRYIEYVRPGGTGIGADDHKVLYNHVSITRILSEEQYSYNLLEYFDQAGHFHQSKWDTKDGFVARSADFDQRNKEHPLSYTSLIVDVWPQEMEVDSRDTVA